MFLSFQSILNPSHQNIEDIVKLLKFSRMKQFKKTHFN